MSRFVLLPLLLVVLTLNAQQRRPSMPTPPEPMNQEPNPGPEQPTFSKHIDIARLQQEADDLARTAQTIPSEVAASAKACCRTMSSRNEKKSKSSRSTCARAES